MKRLLPTLLLPILLLPILLLSILLLLGPALAPARAEESAYDWQQHPGAPLPTTAAFRDEAGAPLALGRVFHGTPVVLDLGYFHCPSLCGVVRADLFNALARSGLAAGRDYELAVVSIDPAETPADAAGAKARDAAAYPDQDAAGWHYLTGSQEAVAAVSAAAGFRATWDPQWKQWLHPTGLVVLNGAGRVSSYLQGVGYTPGDLRTAVIRARSGGIARAALPVLLLCFHYDPATGRYDLVIMKVLRAMGVLTVLTLAGLFVLLSRTRRAGP